MTRAAAEPSITSSDPVTGLGELDFCGYNPIIDDERQAGFYRMYGLSACSNTPTALRTIPWQEPITAKEEFEAWDRATDEAFLKAERSL